VRWGLPAASKVVLRHALAAAVGLFALGAFSGAVVAAAAVQLAVQVAFSMGLPLG
jgi:hypothetical protein